MTRKLRNLIEKRIINIIVEGETEEIYLKNYVKNLIWENNEYRINIIRNTSSLTKEFKNVNVEINKPQNKFDVYYLVFDIDCVSQDKLNTLMAQIKDINQKFNFNFPLGKIDLFYLNPCIEFWFILHFENCRMSLPDDNSANDKLKQFIPNYEKARDYFNILSPKLNTAINNSESINKFHNDNNHTEFTTEYNPNTKLHLLIKFLKNI